MIASLFAVVLTLAGDELPPPSVAPASAPLTPPSAPPAPPSAPLVPPSSPRLTAERAPGPVVLDGRLVDPAWIAAIPTDAFTQQYPHEAAPPTERTTVRVLYDDRALYVGIDCPQKATPIVARLTRRDRVVPADRVTVDISSRGDRATAFHFGVNAAGVLDDGIYFNDTEYAADWDENWQAATSVRPDGWSAEIRIPFRILRFDAAPIQVWGLQVARYTELLHEWDLWAWRPRSSGAFVSTFGVLEGLKGIRPARPIELRWSELAKLRFRDADARGTLAPSHDWTWSFGIDGKMHPTQGTTLDLTVNPDFGQVEADQVVLNLSNFEIFYPEKRSFFLEGQDTWSTARPVLYTRRIGSRPPDPTVTAGETLVDSVGPSRIWAAAKWVGSVSPGTNVGLLSALTGENIGLVRGISGTELARPAADPSLYNVLRAKHRFGLGFDLGVLATSTNRFERPSAYPGLNFQCPNRPSPSDPSVPAIAARCTNDGYVAAVDGRWRSPSANYTLTGQMVASMLVQGPARPQADGIPIAPGRPGFGGTLTAAKQGGAHWLATVTQEVSGRQLDYNDLGYLSRKNDAFTYLDLTYRTLDPWWLTTDTSTTIAASHRLALDGIRLEDHVRLSTFATFNNFWMASVSVYYHAPYFDDRETGDGTALERAGLVGTEFWGTTDSRRLLTGWVWAQFQELTDGVQAQGSSGLTMRPLSRIELELAPSVLYARGEPRFVSKDANAPIYYFGQLRATNVSVTMRATVGLFPTLTLQLYSQLFLATKSFSETRQFDSGPVFRAEVRISDLQPATTFPLGPDGLAKVPNTAQANLNMNVVLRWEYRLGSVMYLVYTRAQNPNLTPMRDGFPRLDPGYLGNNRGSTDVLMLKASFWWG